MLAAALTLALPQPLPPELMALDAQNVVWTSPSENAAGSMPIGNGEVVLNVWVEKSSGDLLFYIARTDALSEISRILKLGRVRLHLEPSPFKNATNFKQTLYLRHGAIVVSGGDATMYLFVDPKKHDIYVLGMSAKPVRATATMECWRNAERVIPKAEQRSAWSVHDAPFELKESADRFISKDNAVVWYHRNETSVVPKVLEHQSLTGLKGTFDPLINRTFGGRMEGEGMILAGDRTLGSKAPSRNLSLRVSTRSAQTRSAEEWTRGLNAEPIKKAAPSALARNLKWWDEFWKRSWVFVDGDSSGEPVPTNKHPLRKGVDSNGQNTFPGKIENWELFGQPYVASVGGSWKRSAALDPSVGTSFPNGFTLAATITPTELKPGRIFDKLTAGTSDGFLFDTHPGSDLRLIVGNITLSAKNVLKVGERTDVAATYNPKTGEAAIYKDGVRVAHRAPQTGSPVTRGYTLQRYCQAIQGRGKYPIKFNGGYYTVEPAAMGQPFNADWRQWGDCHWFQNVRHMTHPMLAQGDFDMTDPFFRLYEAARPLAESRAMSYHGSKGAYFPETMTVWGTYSSGDYGWDRTGHKPNEVLCPWWDDAWNQGPELVALMLDQWDYTRDEAFLKSRVLPMAESVLAYFDTRFKKDANGRIVLDPTQVVETYWTGVVNDMPATAGLIAITDRLNALPARLLSAAQKTTFARMRKACPELPLESNLGHSELAPAQQYAKQVSNVENGELYAVWPFKVVSLAKPKLLEEAKRAYASRMNRLDNGWGYDANVAALLGMTDEAARILKGKVANSNPAYRWPATWGPNFDWLPDQNHGGNLLNTTNLMLLQGDPIEDGGAIRVLPAWPKDWSVDAKLHAPGKTTVHVVAQKGVIKKLEVTPASRRKDVILPAGWTVTSSLRS